MTRARHSQAGFSLAEVLIVVAVLGFAMTAVVGIYQITQKTTLIATAGEDAQVQARAVLAQLGADLRLINAGRAAVAPTAAGAITAASQTTLTFLADTHGGLNPSGNLISLSSAVAAGVTSVTLNDATNINCGASITLADGPIAESHTTASTGCKTGNAVTLGQATFTDYPAGAYVNGVDTAYWSWDSGTQYLCRKVNTACGGTPSAWDPDNDIIATGVTSFQLTYLDSANACLSALASCTGYGTTNATNNRDLIRAIRVRITIRSQSGDQQVSRAMEVSMRPRNLF